MAWSQSVALVRIKSVELCPFPPISNPSYPAKFVALVSIGLSILQVSRSLDVHQILELKSFAGTRVHIDMN